MSLPQNGPKNTPSRKPRKPRNTQLPTKHPYDQSSYPPEGVSQPPYPSSQQQMWSSPQSQPQSTFHGQSTMPFQPGQMAPGFQPPPPPRIVPPTSKKKRPGGCMIGLGILVLLFLCGGINAIVHSQNTQQAQTGATNKGSQTVVVATMPPRATTQLQATRSTQPVAVPTSPAKLEPTPPPVQPTPQSTTPPVQPTPQPTTPPVQPTPQPTAPPAQPTPQPTAPPVQPTPQPTTPAAPACQGVSGNPWCYDFNATGGTTISSPPQDFCTYFTCIKSFWQSTNGYIVECADQQYSHSGGVRGACSRNGGVMNILYQH